jgi:EVE domain
VAFPDFVSHAHDRAWYEPRRDRRTSAMTGHWIAVASAEHVRRGKSEGFIQVSHGKAAPLKRIKPGDRVVYYSPTVTLGGKDRLQAFTAIGTVKEGEPYVFDMGNGFKPYRRDVAWTKKGRRSADSSAARPVGVHHRQAELGLPVPLGSFSDQRRGFPIDRRGHGCGRALTSRPNGA